ncbi:DNA recombination protein RmuC [Demetria terragena]|uniref:DNA recombination protein RmuC n=1 Tax=Demetria terragena TaxID=63959 RepID=UPI0003802439|nr:DNA recombination protein RmuC [Demetria terragena]
MDVLITLALGVVIGAALAALWLRQSFAARSASLATERDLLRERVVDLEAAVSEDAQTAAVLSPLRDALGRVERQVTTLERDRLEQYGALSSRLGEVAQSTASLQQETATLAGALNSSTTRGTWGEMQLRRVLEHAGMLSRCDFEEQVSATNRHGVRVRPDVVVRLPGERTLVLDSKAPLTSFLAAQAEGIPADEQRQALARHAKALRQHVDGLAAKDYWSAFDNAPELVVCFVPGDAILAAALSADPALMDRALERRVVLASPSTLLALLRTVALAWQQDALTTHARELLDLGRELHSRLGRLGQHVTETGTALRRSVDAYNAMVGSLESRVLVTARKLSEMDVVDQPVPEVPLVEAQPRSLSAPELLEHVTREDDRPHLDFELPLDERRRDAG